MSMKILRVVAGFTQADVAKKLDVNQCTISSWESGKTVPCKKYHKKLAKLYGCTVDELLKKDDA